jgi:hypothetical protein
VKTSSKWQIINNNHGDHVAEAIKLEVEEIVEVTGTAALIKGTKVVTQYLILRKHLRL